MLYLEEYQPHFLAFRKVRIALVNQALTEAQFEEQVEAFKRFLGALAARAAWELPLVSGFSRAGEVRETLQEVFDLCSKTTATEFESEKGGAYLNRLEQGLDELVFLQSQLPAFTDIPIISELLVLGTQLPDESGVTQQAMTGRLPHALKWLSDIQAEWNAFGRLNPGRAGLAADVLVILDKIKLGLGGVYLELSGEQPDAAKEGLQLIAKALEELAPAEETRYLVETETMLLSPEIRLERAARFVFRTGVLPMVHRSGINRMLTEWAGRVESLRLWLQISDAPPAEAQTRLAELHRELLGLVTRVAETPETAKTEELNPLLQALEDWRVGFETLSRSLIPLPA